MDVSGGAARHNVTEKVGTIAVERAAGGDRAQKLTEDGWVECDPPPRSATAHDGDAEMWYPETAPSSKKEGPK